VISLARRHSKETNANFTGQFDLLKEAACKRANGCVRSILLPQHSHTSEVYAINTADIRLTDEILQFVKTGR